MKLNSKVIKVELAECECELLKDLLTRCLCFAHDHSSDEVNLDSVNFIKRSLTREGKLFIHDFIFKVL